MQTSKKINDILVIDDNRDFLSLISQAIRTHGYRVVTALTGIEALGALDQNKIDLIISDVIMPETPIMSLTCTLKTLYPEIPIILISGLPKGPMIKNSLTLGADDFIPKPINLNLLFNTIHKYEA